MPLKNSVLSLSELSNLEKESFKKAQLLDPLYYDVLEGINPFTEKKADVAAISFFEIGAPVALALLHIDLIQGAFIFSLKIAHSFEHLSHKIIKTLEDHTKKWGVTQISYLLDEKNDLLITHFKENKWLGFTPQIERYYFDSSLFNPPWLTETIHIKNHIELFPWGELKPHERTWINKKLTLRSLPRELSPLSHEKHIESINSFGARLTDETLNETLLGWIVTHRIDKETIRYSTLFSSPKDGRALSLYLLQKSIQAHIASKVKWALFEITFDLSPKSWIHFVQKKLKPYAQKIEHFLYTWKKL